MSKLLLTFPTTYDSIKGEEVLKKNSVYVKVRPVPRNISSDCGLAIECKLEDEDKVIKLFDTNDVEVEGKHFI